MWLLIVKLFHVLTISIDKNDAIGKVRFSYVTLASILELPSVILHAHIEVVRNKIISSCWLH